MPNPFDQFDAAPAAANPFDTFDAPPPMVNGIPRDIAEDPDLQFHPDVPLTDSYYATPHPGVTPGAGAASAAEPEGFLSRALGFLRKSPLEMASSVAMPIARGLGRADVGGGIQRGATSALASGLHSATDFIDQTLQAPRRQIVEALHPTVNDPATGQVNEQATADLIKALGDPLGIKGVADESLAVEKEINADRARAAAATGGRPSFGQALQDPGAALEQYTAHLATTGAESVPLMAAAIATRNPELAASLLGGATGAQEYTDLRSEGVDRSRAAPAAALSGAVEAAGESFGLPLVMGKGSKSSLLRAMLGEGAQEVPVQLAQQNIEDQATGERTPVGQQLGDALDAFLVGAGMGAGGHGLSTSTDFLTQARAAADAPRVPAAPEAPQGSAIAPETLAAGNAALASAPAAPAAPAPATGDPELDALLMRNVLPESAPTPPAPAAVSPQAAPVPEPTQSAPAPPVAPAAPAALVQRPAVPARAPTPVEASEGRRQWRQTKQRDSRGRPLIEPVLDYSRDGLLEWLGANGGADFEALRAQSGADPALLKDPAVMRPFGRVGWPALRKSGGLDLETLREKMQQDGWLPADDPSAPPTVGLNDVLDRIMDAINGRPVRHPTIGNQERLERQQDDLRQYEEEADAELAADLGFPDAAAMYAEIDRADEQGSALEVGFSQDDYAGAASLNDLSTRAYDAGASSREIVEAASTGTEAERASALWAIIDRLEGSRGADQRADDERREGRGAPGRSEADGFGRIEEEQQGLFPAPSPAEEVAGERRRRDDARNGRASEARSEMSAGDGELFAGGRPDQARIPEAPGRVEASRDMFVPTRGDRAAAESGNGRQDENRDGRTDGDSGSAGARGDDAGSLRPRADATPELTRRAEFAVDELVRRFGGSVLADTIARDFRRKQTAQLIGQQIRSFEDFAALASVYRNPIFETLHYVFVDDAGTVLGEAAISDRMAASSAAFPTEVTNTAGSIADWINEVAPLGTTGLWITHNHPSGNPSPSSADLRMTKFLNELLIRHGGPRLMGHVVLNHKTFAQINDLGEPLGIGHLKVDGPDPLRDNRGLDVSGMVISGPASAAEVGKSIHALTDANSVSVIVTTARGTVSLATAFPAEAFHAKRGPALLSQLGDRSGGLRIFLVASRQLVGEAATGQAGERRKLTMQGIRRLSTLGLVTDVIVEEPSGRFTSMATEGLLPAKTLGAQTKSRRARTDRGDRVFDADVRVEAQRVSYNPQQHEALEKAGLAVDARSTLQRSGDRLREEWRKVRDALRDGDALKQAAFDRFHGLRAAEARMGGVSPEESPYLAARLTTGLPSIMESLNLFGAPQWRGGVLSIAPDTKGLLDALKPVKGDLDSWLGWMVGRRAQLLKSQGRENLFTDDDIAALLSLAKGKEAAFREAAKGYLTIKNAVLDVAEQAGLIDPVQRAAWDHAEYLPFYRQEGDRALGPGTRRGLAGQTSGIRTLKGGESALADPMANIMRNFTKLIDSSMKNRAMLLAVDKLGDTMFEKQGPAFESALIPLDQVKRHLREQGVPDSVIAGMPNGALKGVQKMFSLVPPTGEDIVRVMRDGKAEYYKVADPLVLRSLTAFKAQDKTWAIRPFIFAKRLLTTGVTTTAEFVGANLIRDTASTWIIGNDHVRLGIDAANGAVRTLMKDSATREMMAAGGSFMGGQFYGGDQDATAASLRRALRKKGLKDADVEGFIGTVARTPLMLWDKWMELSSALENANRHAVYQAAIRAGKPKAQAIFEAKDLMDFSMQGDSAFMQFFSDVLPFFNARVQGLYKLGRAAADPKTRRRMAARGALLALASAALWFWNTQRYKDEYDELEEWDKDTYWHIAPGTKWHVRIPKPFEVGLLFGTGPERMAQALAGNDRAEQTWDSLLRAITGTLAINPVPQGVLPIVEQWANRRFFTGRPIENMGDEKLLPEAREEWYTSDTMKLIAAAVGNETGMSPKRLEHLWNGYTGGLGGYVLDASDWLVRQAQDAPERPAATVAELPLFGRFLRGDSPRNTRYVTEFYDLREQAQQVSGTIKEYLEAGKDAKAERLERENAWLLGKRIASKRAKAGIMFENVRAMEKLVRGLGKERRAGEDVITSDATGGEKRERLDSIMAERNDEVKRFVRKIREAQRQKGG